MTTGDDPLERRRRDEAPRGPLAGAAVRRRVIEAAISGAASRRQAARRTVVAVALLVAAVPCLVLLWLPARPTGTRGGSTTTVATVPQTPAAVGSPLPMLAAGFDLSNHSRSLVRDRLAREIERASGGLLTVAGPPAPSTRRPVPAWNDPRHVITAISHPDEIPLLIAKLSREALGSRFGDGER
jgi:hypothetical protein